MLLVHLHGSVLLSECFATLLFIVNFDLGGLGIGKGDWVNLPSGLVLTGMYTSYFLSFCV